MSNILNIIGSHYYPTLSYDPPYWCGQEGGPEEKVRRTGGLEEGSWRTGFGAGATWCLGVS